MNSTQTDVSSGYFFELDNYSKFSASNSNILKSLILECANTFLLKTL